MARAAFGGYFTVNDGVVASENGDDLRRHPRATKIEYASVSFRMHYGPEFTSSGRSFADPHFNAEPRLCWRSHEEGLFLEAADSSISPSTEARPP